MFSASKHIVNTCFIRKYVFIVLSPHFVSQNFIPHRCRVCLERETLGSNITPFHCVRIVQNDSNSTDDVWKHSQVIPKIPPNTIRCDWQRCALRNCWCLCNVHANVFGTKLYSVFCIAHILNMNAYVTCAMVDEWSSDLGLNTTALRVRVYHRLPWLSIFDCSLSSARCPWFTTESSRPYVYEQRVQNEQSHEPAVEMLQSKCHEWLPNIHTIRRICFVSGCRESKRCFKQMSFQK